MISTKKILSLPFKECILTTIIKYISNHSIYIYLCNYKNVKINIFWLISYIFITPRCKYFNEKTITSWLREYTLFHDFCLVSFTVISNLNIHTTVVQPCCLVIFGRESEKGVSQGRMIHTMSLNILNGH